MRKDTVLVHAPCDVKRLPLNAFEGYLLSLVDGRLALDELAEIAGTTVAQISRHAAHLLEVGAVVVAGAAPPPRRDSGPSSVAKRSVRAPAIPRTTPVPTSRRSRRPSAPAERAVASTRPTSARPTSTHPSSARGKPVRTASARSMTARPASVRSNRPGPSDSGAPVEEAIRARIIELDGRLGALDHYGLLGVARDAEKTAIKRAYFALAAEFHPDRYFGKKLGAAKVPLDRIFVRLTEAHDTLTNRAGRAAYDQVLPPLPTPPPPPRRSTKKMKAVESRRASQAAPIVSSPRVAIVSPVPEPGLSARPPNSAQPIISARPPNSAQPIISARPPNSTEPLSGRSPNSAAPSSDEGLRRLYWAKKQNEVERRVAVFVEAAEAALLRDDVVTAVENYRLAVQIKEDVELRHKIKSIEWRSKARIHESSVARGRAAEAAGRWDEAATQYAQANGAKPEAWTAERAAHALRMSDGDIRRAVQLAELAVLAEPQNVAYHLTLGEVCLAAKLFARAAGEASRALAVTPNDERAKALAAAAKKR